MHKRSHQRLEDLLEGVGVLTTPSPLSDEDLYHLVNIAINQLRPQHRQLILLDFVARKEPEEIRRTMGLKSINYFRKVKCEAFKALATAIKSLIEQGVENFF
jgi:DNA-directed RNA polymerase specialized sigma24 family protein